MAKNYIGGSAKVIKGQYGEFMNVSIKLEDLQKLPQNKGYVKITIAERKEADKFGNTHCIFENEYVGNKQETKKDEDIEEPF